MNQPHLGAQGVPKGILALALIGAVPLTLVGLAAACFIFLFSDDSNVSFIGWVLYAGGVLVVFETLAWLPAWCAWVLFKRQKKEYAYLVASLPLIAFVVLVVWFHHAVAFR